MAGCTDDVDTLVFWDNCREGVGRDVSKRASLSSVCAEKTCVCSCFFSHREPV